MVRKRKAKEMEMYGDWAFIAGLVIIVIASVFLGSKESMVAKATYGVIAALGVVVGLLNITKEEVTNFLISVITFLITISFIGQLAAAYFPASSYLTNLLGLFYVFVAPAGFVVAVISIFKSASSK